MVYTSHILPSTPWCVSVQNVEDAARRFLAPAEADLVLSKHLKLFLAAGQTCLLTEELCRTTVTLQSKFSGDFQGQTSQFMNQQLVGSKK